MPRIIYLIFLIFIPYNITAKEVLHLKGTQSCPHNLIAEQSYFYSFESGLSDWVNDATIGFNTWLVTSTDAITGVKSMLVNAVDLQSDQTLSSPTIHLPDTATNLTLSFWNKQAIEDRNGGCYDGAILEISTNNGTSFTQIPNDKLLTDPYDGLVPSGFGSSIPNHEAWCGDPQDWLNSIVVIDEYAGMDAIFRFRIATDSENGRIFGWYIDDVSIQSCVVNSDIIFVFGFE